MSADNFDRSSSCSHQAVYTFDTPGTIPKEVIPNLVITPSPKFHPSNLPTEDPSRPTTTVPTSLPILVPTTAPTFKPMVYPPPGPTESLTTPSLTSNCSVQLAIMCEMASEEGAQMDCVEIPRPTRSKDCILDVRYGYYMFNNVVDAILMGLGRKRVGQTKKIARGYQIKTYIYCF